MTTDCRDTLIRDLQCKFADHIDSLRKALRFRKGNLTCLQRDALIARSFISSLYNYTTFTSKVTAAFSVEITKDSGADTVALLYKVSISTYTGSGDAEDIVDFFMNDLNDNSAIWNAERDGSILYIYSYDASVNFSGTVSITSANSLTSATIKSLEDNLEVILNLWNCLTESQVCSLYEHANKLLTTDCNC